MDIVKHCPNCGCEISGDADFCTECGYDLLRKDYPAQNNEKSFFTALNEKINYSIIIFSFMIFGVFLFCGFHCVVVIFVKWINWFDNLPFVDCGVFSIFWRNFCWIFWMYGQILCFAKLYNVFGKRICGSAVLHWINIYFFSRIIVSY